MGLPRIIVDTREQTPWGFGGFTVRQKGQDIPVEICTVSRRLKTGDYSLEGYEDRIAIERKTVKDIVQTITHHRDRFVRELERGDELEQFVVIIEGEWLDMLQYCGQETGMNPVSLDNSIIAYQLRYKAIWLWRPTVFTAAKTAWKIFDRFHRDLEKEAKHGKEK